MTGLDKIIEAIRADAQQEADSMILAAQARAEDIFKQKEAEAEAQCTAIISQTREKTAAAAKMANSGAALEQRNMLLAEKRRIIDEVIDEGVKALAELPAREYFSVLEQIILDNAQGDGELLLSAEDKKRMPKGFVEKLSTALAKKGASLTLAEDTVETGGGLILRYGGIEENLCFAQIAAQCREELSDMLDAILFN